jgi:HEAT repeat protein
MTRMTNRHRALLVLAVVATVCGGAATALANGDPAALRADALDSLSNLILSAEEIEPAVRNAAIALLGEYGGPQHTAVLLRRLDASTRNEDTVAVVHALGRLGDNAALAMLQQLFNAPDVHRTDDDLRWSVGAAAGDALLDLGDGGVAAVLEALNGMDAEMRRRAVQAIARSEHLTTVERLAPLAGDADRWVRLDVVRILGGLGDPAAVPALKPLLNDADADVRLEAAKSLARLGDASGVKQLERVAQLETERALALRLLARLDPDRNLPALLAHMTEDVSEAELDDLRAHAAAVLGRLRAAEAVDTLIGLLKDPSWDVRREAAGALGRIGSRTALPALRALARQLAGRVHDSSSAPVREACAVALVQLGDPDSAVPICLFQLGERRSLAVSPEVAALVDGEAIERALIDAVRQPDQGQPIARLLDDLRALTLTGSKAAALEIEDLLRTRPYATMLAVNVPEVWAALLDALGGCAGPAAARTAAIYADDEIPLVRVAACRAILRLTSTEQPKGD